MMYMMCNSFLRLPFLEILDKKKDNTYKQEYSDDGNIGNHIPYSDGSVFFYRSNDSFLTTKTKWRITDAKFYFEIVGRDSSDFFCDNQRVPFEKFACFYKGIFIC